MIVAVEMHAFDKVPLHNFEAWYPSMIKLNDQVLSYSNVPTKDFNIAQGC